MAVQKANYVWRDYEIDGVLASGLHKPIPREIRALITYLENGVTGAGAGATIYDSKTSLDADTSQAANAMAWVMGDATASNNGVYQFDGTSTWTRLGDLPYSYIKASNAGAGTANAIVATTSIPVPAADGGALIALPIVADNTASPVTVAFNGGTTLAIKNSSGTDVAIGGLVAGMIVAGYVSGATFRLLTDQAASSIVADAEAVLAEIKTLNLGAFSTANEPTTDLEGNALIVGAEYFNTDDNVIKVWNGTEWLAQGTVPDDSVTTDKLVDEAVTNPKVAEPATPAEGIAGTKIAFVQQGVSAVVRSLQDKLREVGCSVMDFGAKGDNSTDDTAAIKAAFAAAALVKGRTVILPPGTYLYDGATSIDITNATSVLGIGGRNYGTNIRFSGTRNDFLQYKDGGARGWSVQGLTFTASQDCTAGIIIDVADATSGSQDALLKDISARSSFAVHDVIRLRPGVQSVNTQNFIVKGPFHTALYVEGGQNHFLDGFDIDGFQSSGDGTGGVGIRLVATEAAGGIELFSASNGNIGNCDIPLSCVGTAKERFKAAVGCFFSKVFFDDAKYTDSASLTYLLKSTFSSCHFTSAERNGCFLEHSEYIDYIGCHFDTNVNHGLRVGPDSKHVNVIGGSANNNDSRAAGNLYRGIQFDSGATDFSILGVDVYGAGPVYAAGAQDYGINIGANCDRFIIDNIRGGGNTAGTLNNAAGTGASKIVGNIIG